MHTRKKSENKQTTNEITTNTQYPSNKRFKYTPTACCFKFFCTSLQGKTAIIPTWSSSQTASLPIKIDTIKGYFKEYKQ